MALGRSFFVKCLVLAIFCNSFIATSFGSEFSRTITFVSKNPGAKNVEMKVTYPASLDCTWGGGWNGGSGDDEYGSCDTTLIKYELINIYFLDARNLDDSQFKWRQVYFVNGKTITLPWQDFFNGVDHSGARNLFSYNDKPPRFYPTGELQIEFNGLETLGYYTKDSLPRIKLSGPTKAEVIAKQNADAKKAEEERTNWEFDSFNDGIDSFIHVDQYDPYENKTLRIYCQKKRLGAWISAEYANSSGWKGVAQIRFDSKPVKNLSYTVNRQFNSVYIDNPKAFLNDLLKSKKVLVKIGTVNGSELSTFYQGNLKSYRKQFSAKGCKIG